MPKVIAQKKAEEKRKKNSSASAGSEFEKVYSAAHRAYQQEQQQAVQDVKAQQRSLNNGNVTQDGLQNYLNRLTKLRTYGYDISGAAAGARETMSYLDRVQNPTRYASQSDLRRTISGKRAELAAIQQRTKGMHGAAASRARDQYGQRIQNLKNDISGLTNALEFNAYERQLAKLSTSERKMLDDYGRDYRTASDSGIAARLGQIASGFNPTAVAQANAMEREQLERENELRKMLRKKGYSVDQIDALLRNSQKNYNAELNEQIQQSVRNEGALGKAAASLVSVPLNLAGGLTGYADLAAQRLTAKTDPFTGERQSLDYNSRGQMFGNAASGIRSTVSENMSGLGSFLYNTGMSIADFAAAGMTGSGVSEALLAGSAAQQAAQQAHQRGATDSQALAVGLGAGVFEALFEHLSLEKLRGLSQVTEKVAGGLSRVTAKDIAKAVGVQAFTEGSEELFTSIANTAFDAIVMRDKSELNQSIQDYMAQGMSEEQATRQAWKDWAVGLAEDFAGGALSGGLLGGLSGGNALMAQNRVDRTAGRTITEAEYQQRLIQAGLAAPQASRANQLAAQLQEGGATGRRADRMTGQLYNAVNESETQQAMANRLAELGVDAETAQTIASGIRNEMLGDETRAERAAMEQYKTQTDRVKTEYMDAMMGIAQSTNTWARELDNRQAERRAEIFDSLQGRGETAVEQTANIEEGAQNDGQGVLLRGSERNDGQSAGGEVRGMEEGPGRDSGREAWYQPADRELSEGAVPGQGQVTSNQIHPDGVDSDRLYQPTVKTKAMKRAERFAKQHGKKCVFFAGDMLTVKYTMPDGSTENVRCRGMIDGDTIYLRADDAQFTSEQIAKHETTHDLLDTGRISRATVRAAMNARYSPEEIDSIISKYASAFDGMTGEEAWDEIICDAMGGMNIFARSDSQGTGALFRDILNSVYEEAQKNAAENKDTAAENTGGVKFSEEADSDYMAAVERGDMEAAQRMVDEAAKAAGYTIHAYHGTPNGTFTVFRNWQYFTEIKEYADVYQNQGASSNGYKQTADNPKTYDVYLKTERPFDTREPEARKIFENEFYRKWGNGAPLSERGLPDWTDGDDLVEFFEENGYDYDAIYLDEGGTGGYGDEVKDRGISIVIKNPGQVKSAEPVVKDDDGNVIPLSERFNPKKTDIRFSREANAGYEEGVRVIEYETGNDADRTKQLNAVEGVKFSREATNLREANREAEKLRAQVEYWKGQTQRTTRQNAGPNEKDVLDVAKALVKDYDSTEDVQSIRADIRELARYVIRGEGQRHEISWERLSDMAHSIARKIVEPTVEIDPFDGAGEQIRKDLREARVDMTAVKGDFADGWNEIMRLTRGKMISKKGGAGIDTFWMEMQERYGVGVFPEDITHPADQLRYMADLYDQTQTRQVRKSEADYYEELMWCRNDIIDRVLGEEIRQNPPTKMDKALEKADAKRREDLIKARERKGAAVDREREKRKEAVSKEREKARERLAEQAEKFANEKKDYAEKAKQVKDAALEKQKRQMRDRFQEMQKNRRERAAVTETWGKIRNLGKQFRKMADHPTQNATGHATDKLARALAELAEQFQIVNRKKAPARFDDQFRKLQKVYDELKAENSVYYDESLAAALVAVKTDVMGYATTGMTGISTEQLNDIYDLLKWFHHQIVNGNKFTHGQWAVGKIEAGKQWAKEVLAAAPLFKKGLGGRMLNLQLSPDRFFARISGFAKNSVGEQIQKMFVDGEERMLRIQQDAYLHFQKFTESKEFAKLSRYGEKNLVDVGLKDTNGNKVLLTRDMMLAVYMHLRAEDNLMAAAYGGFDIPAAKAYYTGDVATSYEDGVRTASINAEAYELQKKLKDLRGRAAELESVNPENYQTVWEERERVRDEIERVQSELQAYEGEMIGTLLDVRTKIGKMLTEYERGFVEAAEEWQKKCGEYINKETLAMYGFEKATVERHWTIHRNQNFVNTDLTATTDEVNLENWGGLKERVKNRDPVLLTGFVFELENHTQKVSQYCGFAAVQRDFNQIYKARVPNMNTTLAEIIDKKFGGDMKKAGTSAKAYIKKYIEDIAGGGTKEKRSPLAPVRQNLARATLSINFRVAVSQVASIPTAAAEVGWGAMAKGWARYSLKGLSAKQQMALAAADPWFWQRSRGEGGMREFAEMHESNNAFDRAYNKIEGTKVGKAILNWCQRFDMYATYTQWAMAEEWAKKNTNYQAGSAEYEAAVAAKYRDIIRKTQPNYTTTERSDLLRDTREVMKWATMYKTQSNQNLNILYEATARLHQYNRDFKAGKNGVTEADLKEARIAFANAYTGVIIGGTVSFVLFRAVANAILHAVNGFRDDDDELTWDGIMKGLMKETLSAISGMFVLGSEVFDIVYSLVSGSKYYGLTDSAVGALSDVLTKAVDMLQKKSAGEEIPKDDIEKLVFALMNPLGIPGKNVMQIVNGLWGHIEDIQNGEFLSFESGVKRTGKTEAKKLVDAAVAGDGEKTKKAWEHLLDTKASNKDPEKDAQEAVRDRLKEMFIGGEVSEKDVKKILQAYGGKDADGAAEWLNGAKCKKETGYAPDDLKEGWLEGAFGDEKAKKYLTTYTGKDAEEAEETLQEWRVTKKYGFTYDETGEMYAKGKISETEAKKILTTYGGYDEADANEKVLKWGVRKKYGFDYGDTLEQYTGGKISGEEAATIWSEYGGMSDEKIADKLLTADFLVEHPEVDEDTVTANRVEQYESFGKGNHIPAADFMKYAQKVRSNDFTGDVDAKGDSIPYSKQRKIVAWIDTLDLSPAQKTAIFATYWNDGKIPSKSYSLITW